jgi:AAA+ ATPase superfamily predicted ATPase
MSDIIGRKNAINILQKTFSSPKSEFLAIYGRRRVGKTYLIRQFFSKKSCVFFQVTGKKKWKHTRTTVHLFKSNRTYLLSTTHLIKRTQ